MYAHRVNIFDKADGDHLTFLIADDFQFKLFPSDHRFLDQNLVDQRGLQSAFADHLQFLHIVDEASSGSAHGVSRTKNNRVTDFICN